MSGHNKGRDDERDAWLSHALRHAPDANADAPAALSDTILREARAASVRSAIPAPAPAPRRAPTGPMQWLASAWAALARPPVAAGFASVMVATLVGMLWWDRPLDESLPPAPEPVSSTPQARAEAAAGAAAAAATAPAAPQVQTPPTAQAQANPAPRAPGSAARAPVAPGAVNETKDAAKSSRAQKPANEPARARTDAESAPAVTGRGAAPAAFPVTPPAPAPQAAAAANEARPSFAPRRELATPAAKAPAELLAQGAADAAQSSRGELRATESSASPSLAKARSAEAASAPLAALRLSVAQQPERWRWQRGSGAAQPMSEAVQRWLAEFNRLSAPRWQAGTDNNAARDSAATLRLFRDGVLQATLGLAGATAWVEAGSAAAPASYTASLPEGSAQALQKALEDSTP